MDAIRRRGWVLIKVKILLNFSVLLWCVWRMVTYRLDYRYDSHLYLYRYLVFGGGRVPVASKLLVPCRQRRACAGRQQCGPQFDKAAPGVRINALPYATIVDTPSCLHKKHEVATLRRPGVCIGGAD